MDKANLEKLRDLIDGVIRDEKLIDKAGEEVSVGRFLDRVAHSWEVDHWRTVPQPKIIDLSCLVGSDVLCEFWDGDGNRALGKLESIDKSAMPGKAMYAIEDRLSSHQTLYACCRPSIGMQAITCYMMEDMPIPTGVDFEVLHSEPRGAERVKLTVIGGKWDDYIWPDEVGK